MIQYLIPMGGEAKSFQEAGGVFPKPLIDIGGKPMIEIVVDNLRPKEAHSFTFVCKRDHLQKFALADVLNLVAPGSKIVPMQNTAGALCSCLLAIGEIDPEQELVISNADQFVDASIDDIIASARAGNWDGYIVTFPSTHPKWSYAKVDDGHVVQVAEKRPISRNATTGIYYFKKAADFLIGADRVITKNAAVSGEYYVCPVYNELILMGKKVGIYQIERTQMHSFGSPDDVASFNAFERNRLGTAHA